MTARGVYGTERAIPGGQGRNPMLLTIGIILVICWALGLFAFHVAGGLIHILIVLAVIAIIVHFLRGSRV